MLSAPWLLRVSGGAHTVDGHRGLPALGLGLPGHSHCWSYSKDGSGKVAPRAIALAAALTMSLR